jgi:general secretion pathway protein J
MRNRYKAQHGSGAEGFTLVEMLVSVTLIAMMAVALWSVLRISVRSWQRGTESIDANQQHRATLDLMLKQVASISAIILPSDPQTGIGPHPVFIGSETSVQFISLCALRFQDNPGLTLVSYDAAAGSDGDYSLAERETRYLGGPLDQDAGFDEMAVPGVTIFEHLASLVFEYFDPGDSQNEPQWFKEWDATDVGYLPTAIRMTLSTRDANGVPQSRQIVIPVQAKSNNLNNLQPGFMIQMGNQGRGARGNNPRTGR